MLAVTAILGMLVKYFRCNNTSGSTDLLSICFCAVRLICAISALILCERFRSRFAQFDPFFAGSIAICASWIHLRLVRFIFGAFDLIFGGSIYFCAV